MNIRLVTILFLLPVMTFAQQYTLTGKIAGLNGDVVSIHSFYGSENKKMDSVAVQSDGSFSYIFARDAYSGMYRLRWGKSQFMDVIFNHENINFQTHTASVVDSLVFSKSQENEIYFDYLKQRNDTEYKMELLYPLMDRYPKDDPFYGQVTTQYDLINNRLNVYVDDIVARHRGTYAARLVNADFTPRPDSRLDEDNHIEFLKAHYFDRIDFTDTTLLYSNVVANKIIQYLSLYQNNRLDKDQLQVEFIKAVSVIMARTKASPTVYEYAMNYLIDGFNSYGFDKVITYIADNINLDEQCYDTERKAELEKKVESLKKFAVGLKAPDFSTTDLNGKTMKLSEISSEYTLLVFWATWCPHCNSLVKELQKIYLPDNHHRLEIIAVSLDESKQELDAFLQQGNYNWINICDFKKWKGELVQMYDIFATPTMFLLYNDQTILAKPITYNELMDELFKRNILK